MWIAGSYTHLNVGMSEQEPHELKRLKSSPWSPLIFLIGGLCTAGVRPWPLWVRTHSTVTEDVCGAGPCALVSYRPPAYAGTTGHRAKPQLFVECSLIQSWLVNNWGGRETSQKTSGEAGVLFQKYTYDHLPETLGTVHLLLGFSFLPLENLKSEAAGVTLFLFVVVWCFSVQVSSGPAVVI